MMPEHVYAKAASGLVLALMLSLGAGQAMGIATIHIEKQVNITDGTDFLFEIAPLTGTVVYTQTLTVSPAAAAFTFTYPITVTLTGTSGEQWVVTETMTISDTLAGWMPVSVGIVSPGDPNDTSFWREGTDPKRMIAAVLDVDPNEEIWVTFTNERVGQIGAIPEPATVALGAIGLLGGGLLALRRRTR